VLTKTFLTEMGKTRNPAFSILFLGITAFLARGQSMLGNFSVDDVALFGQPASQANEHNLSMGRFLNVAIAYILDNSVTSLTSMAWSVWPVVLFLSAVSLYLILRLLSIPNNLSNLIIVSIAITHPYLAEIFSFQIAAFVSLLAQILLILLLLVQISGLNRLAKFAWSSFIIFALLSIYQVYINYIVVLLVLLLVFSSLSATETSRLREVFKTLFYSLVVASAALIVSARVIQASINIAPSARSNFLSVSDMPFRMSQVMDVTSGMLFGTNEPVFGGFPKLIFGFVTLFAIFVLTLRLLGKFRNQSNLTETAWSIGALTSLIACLLFLPGIISILEDWWPVPRVLSHVALFSGLVLLGALIEVEKVIREVKPKIFVKLTATLLVALSSSGSILASNQIFTDQATVNRLDRNLASSIVVSLEENQGYEKVQSVAIVGRFYSYPLGVQTMQRDLNISAFMTAPHKLLSLISGKEFVPANPGDQELANRACLELPLYPAQGSVFVMGDIAVVCLHR